MQSAQNQPLMCIKSMAGQFQSSSIPNENHESDDTGDQRFCFFCFLTLSGCIRTHGCSQYKCIYYCPLWMYSPDKDLNTNSEQCPSPKILFPLSTHPPMESDHRTTTGQALFEWLTILITVEKRHDTDTITVAVIQRT